MTEGWIARAKEAARRKKPETTRRGKFVATPVDVDDSESVKERLALIDSVLNDAERVLNDPEHAKRRRQRNQA